MSLSINDRECFDLLNDCWLLTYSLSKDLKYKRGIG